MNDSSWQPEPVPAGPAYDAQVGPHTRPMPIVPDAAGRDFDDREARDRGVAADSGPLFRADTPSQEPMPSPRLRTPSSRRTPRPRPLRSARAGICVPP